MKICPVEAGLFHADGKMGKWTDMTKLIVNFRNFAKAPKNACSKYPYRHTLLYR
jgi:hypothetical protein